MDHTIRKQHYYYNQRGANFFFQTNLMASLTRGPSPRGSTSTALTPRGTLGFVSRREHTPFNLNNIGDRLQSTQFT